MSGLSMNREIKKLLDKYGYPVEYMVYTGTETPYFVFNFDDERGVLFADGKSIIDVYSLQIHFFAPLDQSYSDLKNTIKKDLENAGWTYPVVQTFYEDKLLHIVFSCEKED